MNLPTGWEEATGYSPLLLVVVALLGASLLVFFLAPVFFNLLKKIKLPARFGFIKRHPKRSLAAIIVVFLAVFGGYVYYYFSQPVRIVSATQFKLEKGKQVRQLQQIGFSAWKSLGLYMLDVRSGSEYSTEHIKGSASLPVSLASKRYPMKNVDIVIYSSASRFSEVRLVADAIKKNGESLKAKRSDRSKYGTIYIVKDGFEGLKKAGLAVEAGIWD